MNRKIYPLLIVAAALALIVWGWSRGEASAVFAKASRFCLDCMGLGR